MAELNPSNTPVKAILNQNAFSDESGLPEDIQQLYQRRQATLGPMTMLFYKQPLHLVSGKGVWLHDADGKHYLDAYNNVPCLGHCHPKVVEAVSKQLTTLNIHTRYLDEAIHHYSEKLCASTGLKDKRVTFTCSGSEANDLAIRMAQLSTGKKGIIVSRAAYHGNTQLSMSVSPSAFKQESNLPDWVKVIDLPFDIESEEAANTFLKATKALIAELEQSEYGFCALLMDSIFSSDGILSHPIDWMKPAVDYAQAQGGLFIADEVQPGFGRTGECFWGYQRHHLMPDIITMGKPMGNGFPVSALITSSELMDVINQHCGYFNTFGGSSAAIAAANATFDVLKQEQLQENAFSVGNYLKQSLEEITKLRDNFAGVRGSGFYLGVDIIDADGQPSATMANGIVNLLRHQGVLVGLTGSKGNTLKIRPPLCFDKSNVDYLIERLLTITSPQILENTL